MLGFYERLSVATAWQRGVEGQRRRTPDSCLWVFTSERQRPESISVEVDSDRVVFRPRFPVSHFLL